MAETLSSHLAATERRYAAQCSMGEGRTAGRRSRRSAARKPPSSASRTSIMRLWGEDRGRSV